MTATRAFLGTLQLDQGDLTWRLYRGTHARSVAIRMSGQRYAEVAQFVRQLGGQPTFLRLEGVSGIGEGAPRQVTTFPEVYVYRVHRLNDKLLEIVVFDSRFPLSRRVGDADFNMSFGDGVLEGTEFPTYREAIENYVRRFRNDDGLEPDAFDAIPERELERDVHLSAMVAPDPLGYLCDHAGCDLTVEPLTGRWRFASKADAASGLWFAGWDQYSWVNKPGFIDNEAIHLQRPLNIDVYSWETHCIRVQGSDPQSTIAAAGPASTQVELEQVYLWDGEYVTLDIMLLRAGFGPTFIQDRQIAEAFLSSNADGSPLHPINTIQRARVWGTIQRDWRRLWRLNFPNGSIGGWVDWRFGQLEPDGSVTPVSVECPSVVFSASYRVRDGNELFGQPWTTNLPPDESPFKATWDDGPESGVIRLYVEPDASRQLDAAPPMPGQLFVRRPGGVQDDALRLVEKDELDNQEGAASTVRNLTLVGREDISLGRFRQSFSIAVYMVARRFMPNSNERWHRHEAPGFPDGDIDRVELPPGELQALRDFVRLPDKPPGPDGLGLLLNEDEMIADGDRRAEVWKIVHSPGVTGEGEAARLDILQRPRLVDGPVEGVDVELRGGQIRCRVKVGNLADEKTQRLIADQRLADRRNEAQGKE
jgi:hypothetical protein